MLGLYEKAAQMRKWTNQIKIKIDEDAKAQVEKEMRIAINEANPSAEPFIGNFNEA